MRRKDKAITEREIIDNIIHGAQICHLACSLNDQPYVIPVSFGYDGTKVYIHTARAGKKNEIFKQNSRVCLAFNKDIELIVNQERACGWSFNFQSVIAEGEINEINDPDLKKTALNHIMRHYSGKEWEMPEKSIAGTNAWNVELRTITGKRSPAESKK